MRKTPLFATVMLALLTLTALTPVVKAVGFTWDDLTYVEGYTVAYPHPDRDVYGISPFSSWSMDGWKLEHHQFDRAKSLLIVRSAPVVCAAIGAVIGAKIGGGYGAAIVTVVGLAIGLYVTYVADSLFLDEHNCIWWWVSIEFMDYLEAWAPLIALYAVGNPQWAQNIVFNLLEEYGYIRVGKVTFLDKINPTWCKSDLTNDGVVDMRDLGMVCAAFGSVEGDPRWNPDYDMDGNNLIDIRDIAVVARDFGKYSPIWPLPIE